MSLLLQTGIELKELIDNIEHHSQCIGHCVTMEQDALKPDSDDDDNDDDKEKTDDCHHLRNFLSQFRMMFTNEHYIYDVDDTSPFFQTPQEQFSISIFDSRHVSLMTIIPKEIYTMEEDENDIHPYLEELYALGSPSPYGDVKTMQTVVNNEVRQAREIPYRASTDSMSYFTVTAEMIKCVQRLWKEQFYVADGTTTNIVAQPYKINIYGPNGHFEPHRDTPETYLVGTFLLGLGSTVMDDGGGALTIQLSSPNHVVRWENSKSGSYAAFFPSLVHSVTRIESGYRATLAFKIFAFPENLVLTRNQEDEIVSLSSMMSFLGDDDHHVQDPVDEITASSTLTIVEKQVVNEEEEEEKTVFSLLDNLTNLFRTSCPNGYGIMLQYQYCIDTDQLQGSDQVLIEVAKQISGAKIMTIPVVTKYEHEKDVGDDDRYITCRTRVYPLILSKKHKPIQKPKTGLLPFYTVNDQDGYLWNDHLDEGAMHTGNESRPECRDSIYLHYALIILPDEWDVPGASTDSSSTIPEASSPTPTKNDTRRNCRYGLACYRKNPKHFEEFSHPE